MAKEFCFGSQTPLLSIDGWEKTTPAIDWASFLRLNNDMLTEVLLVAVSTQVSTGSAPPKSDSDLTLCLTPAHDVKTASRPDHVPLMEFAAQADWHNLAGSRHRYASRWALRRCGDAAFQGPVAAAWAR